MCRRPLSGGETASIIVKDRNSTWRYAIKQDFESARLGARRVHVKVQKCHLIGGPLTKYVRYRPLYHLDVRFILESLPHMIFNVGGAILVIGERIKMWRIGKISLRGI